MRLYSLLLLLSLLACEVRSEREERPSTKQESTPEKQPEPIKEAPILPKEEPKGLALAMRYSLPRANGVFVIDLRRLLGGSVVGSMSADMAKMLALSPKWLQLQNATGLDPARDVRGVVTSFRQVTGKPTEAVIAVIGDFDVSLIAGKAVAAGRYAEAAGDVLLIGESALLAEAKAAKELAPFATSPAISGLISQIDPARPLYGALLPLPSTGAVEKASQVMIELDLDKALYLKSIMLFGTSTEADAAKAEIEKGVAQVGPMVSMFGVSDPSKITKAIGVSTDANKLTLTVSIEEATATTMIRAMTGLSKGIAPPPPPPPPPPSTIIPG